MGAVGVVGIAAIVLAVGVVAFVTTTDSRIRADTWRVLRRPRTWLVGVPATVLALVVGLPYLYLRLATGDAAAPLTFADLAPKVRGAVAAEVTSTTVATTNAVAISATPGGHTGARATTAALPPSPIAGVWRVGSGTQAGYSVDDNAMGQTMRVVGRTSVVSGTAQVVGTTVTGVDVVVDMRSVTCHCVHDSKYQDLLDTDVYPTSTFHLTQPMAVTVPPPGTVVEIPVTGNFTIHGVTRSVTFQLKATRIGDRVAINGSIPVRLEDYNVDSNSSSFGGLSNCDIDLLIAFDHVG